MQLITIKLVEAKENNDSEVINRINSVYKRTLDRLDCFLVSWFVDNGPLPSNLRNLDIFWLRTRVLVNRKAHKKPILVIKPLFQVSFLFDFFEDFHAEYRLTFIVFFGLPVTWWPTDGLPVTWWLTDRVKFLFYKKI